MGGGPLLLKLVNPIKVARSWPANEFRIQQLLISQADPQMRATHTSVLGKANPAVRKELARFNLISCSLNQLAKFPSLLFINARLQILNFRRVLSHEDNQSNIREPSHPGIADELWIEGQEPLRLFWIAAGRRFPVDDAFLPVEFTNSVYVREELAPGRERARQFHLQILLGMPYPNPII